MITKDIAYPVIGDKTWKKYVPQSVKNVTFYNFI